MEMRLRSQRYNLVFRQAARIGGIFLILMSVIRFIYYFLCSPSFEIIEKSVMIRAFVIGFRFDLLVVGFIMIPIAFLGALWFLAGGAEELFIKILKIYFSICWFLILLTSAISLTHYMHDGHHFRFGDELYWPHLDLTTLILISLIFLFMLASVLKTVWKYFEYPYDYLLKDWKMPAGLEVFLRVLVTIIFVILAARGSLGARHLEKEDAQISPWDNVTELALNPVWSINKHY